MSANCPHCGGALDAPAAHRGELERQLGDATKAARLRERAQTREYACYGDVAARLDAEFIAWRGYVWAKVRARKPATCCVSGAVIPAGGWAWRQLSEVRDRDLRVAAGVWAGL